MPAMQPLTELDQRYSDEGATATDWADGQTYLEKAELFWVSTVRPDGRPHVTPLVGVWMDGAMYFASGPDEQKSKNLAANPHCTLTTGCNSWNEGIDLVVEGEAVVVRDGLELERVAAAYLAKYGSDWAFEVRDGVFAHGAGEALVYGVAPTRAYGFAKGEPFGHTRWSFAR